MNNFIITITEKQWEDMRDEADACLYLPLLGGLVKVELAAPHTWLKGNNVADVNYDGVAIASVYSFFV